MTSLLFSDSSGLWNRDPSGAQQDRVALPESQAPLRRPQEGPAFHPNGWHRKVERKSPFFFDAKVSEEHKLNCVTVLSVLKRRMFVELVKNKMQNSNFQVSQRGEKTARCQRETQLTATRCLLCREHLVWPAQNYAPHVHYLIFTGTLGRWYHDVTIPDYQMTGLRLRDLKSFVQSHTAR